MDALKHPMLLSLQLGLFLIISLKSQTLSKQKKFLQIIFFFKKKKNHKNSTFNKSYPPI